jgi:hypothetical protein
MNSVDRDVEIVRIAKEIIRFGKMLIETSRTEWEVESIWREIDRLNTSLYKKNLE